jgi:hypothetical protein
MRVIPGTISAFLPFQRSPALVILSSRLFPYTSSYFFLAGIMMLESGFFILNSTISKYYIQYLSRWYAQLTFVFLFCAVPNNYKPLRRVPLHYQGRTMNLTALQREVLIHLPYWFNIISYFVTFEIL